MLVPIYSISALPRLEASSFKRYEGWVWFSTLLSALQHAAASQGTRKFVLRSSSPLCAEENGLGIWLFSKTTFTTSLAALADRNSMCGAVGDTVWKGSKIFFYHPQAAMSHSGGHSEALEPLEVPAPVYEWAKAALLRWHHTLHPDIKQMFAGWSTSFLARPVEQPNASVHTS
jgi:hypothetical protein